MKVPVLVLIYLGFFFHKGKAVNTTCGENEEYSSCVGCRQTCSNLDNYFCAHRQCSPGCICRPDYVLGPDKKCILPQNCPVGPCKDNEIISNCVIPCNTCEQRGQCFYEYCSRGCDCKSGFYRNSAEQCVPEKSCLVKDATCGRNERYVTCVSWCNDCWSRGDCEQNYCQAGCDCNPGYFRDDNNICVPENQCLYGATECGENEEYTDCVCPCNDCQSRCTCRFACDQSGCDCRRGYHRNSKGICIPADQCTQEPTGISPRSRDYNNYNCPVNEEYYLCVPTCRNTCETYNDLLTGCSTTCLPGCSCKQGLVRNKQGVCVSPQDCPQKCGLHEEFSECGSACPVSCDSLGKKTICTQQCVKGCFCILGYVRGPDGKCIKPELCPTVCGENEQFETCPTTCPPACHNRTSPTSDCPKICMSGCFCLPGFFRDTITGKCVPPELCPAECGENEEFDICRTTCPLTCQNLTQTEHCYSTCKRGCFCKHGFVRDTTTGKCVLPSSCPTECGENEVFRECGSRCELFCDNIGKEVTCTLQCVKGCFCKDGFVRRSSDKRCIPINQCPPVCAENEEFNPCGTCCPVTCANFTKPQGCPKNCCPGCFCKPGFVKGPDGNCIDIRYCPGVCGVNEEFKQCGPPCQATCDVKPNCPNGCVNGCYCKIGFVRGPNGTCIDETSCPTLELCPLQNEEFLECGPSCIRTCARIQQRKFCPTICIRGCFCKNGTVRDIEGNCRLPQNCPQEPQQCPEGQTFFMCKPTCKNTCNNLQNSHPCENICRAGCFCKKGTFLRNDGQCVPLENCSDDPEQIRMIEGRRFDDDDLTELPTELEGDIATPTVAISTAEKVTSSAKTTSSETTSKSTVKGTNPPPEVTAGEATKPPATTNSSPPSGKTDPNTGSSASVTTDTIPPTS